MTSKKNLLILTLILIAAHIVAGCAGTKPMAISPENKSFNTDSESVALLFVRTRNTVNDGYLPEIQIVEILDRNTKKTVKFNCANSIIHPTGAFLEHLVSFQLPPGEYQIKEIRGSAQVNRSQAMSFLVAPAHFEWELCGIFDLKPDEVAYLGHMELTNRDRKEGEKASGSSLPFIPQKASGFSAGTFDVTVDDQMEEDMQSVSNCCQWINDYPIHSSLLLLKSDNETK